MPAETKIWVLLSASVESGNSVYFSKFLYLYSSGQKKSTDNSSFHRAFFCAGQEKNYIFFRGPEKVLLNALF